MSRPALRFWGTAAAVAIVFSALVPVLFPYALVGRDPVADRDAMWMLVVFTTGVMMVLFGVAALIGGKRSVGVRDVVEAGSVSQALARQGRGEAAPGSMYNVAVWTVVTGALLLLIYFALWLALR